MILARWLTLLIGAVAALAVAFGVIQLTQNPADAWEPAWSPSGAKILFSSRRDENWEVYAMNADGAGQANLTTNPAQDQEPDEPSSDDPQ